MFSPFVDRGPHWRFGLRPAC